MRIIKKTLEITLPIMLGASIMAWMYRHTDWREVGQALADMRWEWMLLSFVFGVMAQVLRGWRWQLALRPLGEQVRKASCVDSVFVSYAASLVVPRIGEVTRCAMLKKSDDVTFSKALGTVVTERIVDSVVMLLLCGLTFLWQIPTFHTFFDATGTGMTDLLARFTATGYLVSAVCLIAIVILLVVLGVRLKFFARFRGIFQNLWAGIMSLRNTDSPYLYIAYSLGIWLCYYLHFYLVIYCFDFTDMLTPMQALVIFCVGTFAVLVPTPNGAGPWHFAVKTMLVLYGVVADSAVLFALVVHTLQTALVVLLGGLGWLGLTLRRPLCQDQLREKNSHTQ